MLTSMTTGVPAKRVPRAVREQQMLDAAVRVFSRRGYHAAGVDEIAEAAGISKPMVYAYLGTKEELFIACLHREGTRLMEAVAEVAGVEVDRPGRRLCLGLEAFFRFVAANRDAWSVLHRQARGQEPFAGVIAQMRSRWIEIVADVLREAVPEVGDVTPAAYALVGAVESLSDWIAEHGADDADPQATAARLADLILRGLRPASA
jgi:AcrR family transcriptional regulator